MSCFSLGHRDFSASLDRLLQLQCRQQTVHREVPAGVLKSVWSLSRYTVLVWEVLDIEKELSLGVNREPRDNGDHGTEW